jgi:hypothetical protein
MVLPNDQGRILTAQEPGKLCRQCSGVDYFSGFSHILELVKGPLDKAELSFYVKTSLHAYFSAFHLCFLHA